MYGLNMLGLGAQGPWALRRNTAKASRDDNAECTNTTTSTESVTELPCDRNSSLPMQGSDLKGGRTNSEGTGALAPCQGPAMLDALPHRVRHEGRLLAGGKELCTLRSCQCFNLECHQKLGGGIAHLHFCHHQRTHSDKL